MDSISRQLRVILRSLGRSPLFTTIAVATLAVGIGANTAVFSVVHSVLLEPLPFVEPERLVGVWHKAPGIGFEVFNQSPALYFTYRDESRTFADSGMWDNDRVAVTSLEEPEEVPALRVSDGTLPLLGVKPLLGRLFTHEDDAPGSPETVILGYRYWQERFGGEAGVLGESLTIDGSPREIIGVLGEGFRFLDRDPDVLLPFRFDRAEVFFGNFSYQGVARLAPGATIEQANEELARLIPVALERFPLPEGFSKAMVEEMRFGPHVRPFKVDAVGDVGSLLWMLLGAGGLVLLVACANVAHLLLVRAEAQRQALAVRAALGAGRARLGREMLGESLVLGLAGGALGLGLAMAGVRLLTYLEPRGLPRLEEIAVHPAALAFNLAASLVAALLFGALPILRLRRLDLGSTLKEGGRGAGVGRQRQRGRNALVAAQIAVALVLLIGSGLMLRTLVALSRVEPGFTGPEEVLTLRLTIPTAEVEDPAEVALLFEAIQGRLAAVAGVAAVGMSSSVAMDGWDSNDPVFVEDFPVPANQLPVLRRFKWIAPGYFSTLGIPLLAGRDLTWDDLHQRRDVVVVSEGLVREYWGEPAAALGRRIRVEPTMEWREIVGVVGAVHDDGVTREPPAIAYWPMVMEGFWDQELFAARSMAFALRSPRAGTSAFLDEVRAAVAAVRPSLPLSRVATLEEHLERSLARTSFTVAMLALATLAALLLAAIGIYGVTSYAVTLRTREIGVRIAFGARPGDVRRLVLRHAGWLAVSGVAAGVVGAVALTRLLAALLHGVSPLDPLSFLAGGVGVALLAIAASWLPAHRAAGVDPIVTLRWD